MELQRVKLEAAKQLREANFPFSYSNWVYEDGLLVKGKTFPFSSPSDYGDKYQPAPTLELVKMWFRESHNIHIEPMLGGFIGSEKCDEYFCMVQDDDLDIGFSTYNEALEAGIVKAIKILRNED